MADQAALRDLISQAAERNGARYVLKTTDMQARSSLSHRLCLQGRDVNAVSGQHMADQAALRDLISQAAERDRARESSSAFTCGITMEPFREPVITPSGHSYEKSALEEHLLKVCTVN